ncbi:hypothetical protein AVEN_118415-1 [Araneus ventricosus]|uniref:DDE-1 domain-containing protein n=1 Tax=Araneus ventricosus TaxID=182803 RepID=A0A4Y2B594_ARAVE|nr:hypothetical protein AVEN_118415-1 [Araneus ventricosus]
MNLQNFLKKRALFVPTDGWIGLRSGTTLGAAKLWVKPLVFVLPISITGWKLFGRTLFAITMKRKHFFNADETGLFYKLTPNKTLNFKGEKCVGGKLSKVRITILVCSNMNGSEKKKLTVIGKS